MMDISTLYAAYGAASEKLLAIDPKGLAGIGAGLAIGLGACGAAIGIGIAAGRHLNLRRDNQRSTENSRRCF